MGTAMWVAGLLVWGVLVGPQVRGAEEPREADHEALRALRAQVTRAINARDVEALMSCFAEEFVFTATDQTVLTDRAGIEAYLNRWFKDPKSPLKTLTTEATADILTRFTDPNTAYCYGSSDDVYTLKNGHRVSIAGRWTAIVVKQAGTWKVAAAHAGVNFVDNPVMALRTMSWCRKLGVALGLAKLPGEK